MFLFTSCTFGNKMVDKIIENRAEFIKHLSADLESTLQAIETTTKSINNLEEVMKSIQTLSTKVEHEALIPMGHLIYANGTIKHTGEYFVDLTGNYSKSGPYSVLETTDNTLRILTTRIDRKNDDLGKLVEQKKQIEERIGLFEGGKEEPERIVSDRGIALKVGEFYEIIEYEE